MDNCFNIVIVTFRKQRIEKQWLWSLCWSWARNGFIDYKEWSRCLGHTVAPVTNSGIVVHKKTLMAGKRLLGDLDSVKSRTKWTKSMNQWRNVGLFTPPPTPPDSPFLDLNVPQSFWLLMCPLMCASHPFPTGLVLKANIKALTVLSRDTWTLPFSAMIGVKIETIWPVLYYLDASRESGSRICSNGTSSLISLSPTHIKYSSWSCSAVPHRISWI